MNWPSFKDYLSKNHSKKHIKDVMNYAMKYGNCLFANDFSELLSFSASKRRHVLASLANLSKFLGMYEVFQNLKKKHGLKWESTKVEDLIISRMNKTVDYGEVLKWLNELKVEFPHLSDFLDFVLTSGLRFAEAVNSYNLIIDLFREGNLENYYNAEKEVLEHYKFRKFFLRNTKKAFLSFIPEKLIDRIKEQKKLTTYQIRNPIKRSNRRLRFGDVRECFATFMTKYLTQPEIDFLQGRVSASVFMRHYFNPALLSDLKERAFEGIKNLTRDTLIRSSFCDNKQSGV